MNLFGTLTHFIIVSVFIAAVIEQVSHECVVCAFHSVWEMTAVEDATIQAFLIEKSPKFFLIIFTVRNGCFIIIFFT